MGPSSLRLRCGLRKMQNLQQKTPPHAWPACKALVADRRDAATGPEAERRRQARVERHQRDFPEAGRCRLAEAEASLNPLYVPRRHQQYVRTPTPAERAFEEERRRTKVIPHVRDEGGVVKLVFAVLVRVSARWGKEGFGGFARRPIGSLRARLTLDEQGVNTSDLRPGVRSRRRAASAA
jgi:putative transposase